MDMILSILGKETNALLPKDARTFVFISGEPVAIISIVGNCEKSMQNVLLYVLKTISIIIRLFPRIRLISAIFAL